MDVKNIFVAIFHWFEHILSLSHQCAIGDNANVSRFLSEYQSSFME